MTRPSGLVRAGLIHRHRRRTGRRVLAALFQITPLAVAMIAVSNPTGAI